MLVARLARSQYGIFSRAQAQAAGASGSAIQRRVEAGRWERIFPGVYLISGVPPSWHQMLIAAVMAGGDDAFASHRSAARLWAPAGFEEDLLEIVIPRGRRRMPPGVVVHRPRDLEPVDVTQRNGIPVTTPTRTLIDLAGVAGIEVVEEALDDLLRRGLTTLSRLDRRLRRLARNGRPGIPAIRGLLEERGGGARVPESTFETRLVRLLRRAALPAPVVQHEIRHLGRLVARVDFAYPDHMLAIEADGYRNHSGRVRFERDRERRNTLTALGWRVIHVTWAQLHNDPNGVIGQIAAALVASGRHPARAGSRSGSIPPGGVA